MPKLLGVQYLRAVAAIAVLVFHSASRFHIDFRGGGAGVDVFFVISGFLMIAITGPSTRPWSFFRERVQRIVPIYWFATSVMVIGAIAGLFPNLKITFWYTAASYLFLPAPNPTTGDIWPVLAPGWTLNYEMFFYASFAILLFLGSQLRVVVALTALFGGLVLVGATLSNDSIGMQFYTNFIMLEFALGAWIGCLWKFPEALWLRIPARLLTAASSGALALAMLVVPDMPEVAMYGLPAAGMLIGVLALQRQGLVRHYRLPELCGDASYSIYLWHGLAVSAAGLAAARLGLPALIGVGLAIVLGVLIGIISFWTVERPLMRWFRRRRKGSETAGGASKSVDEVGKAEPLPTI